jgi:ubiquinone/menaquinone biosynthesis C-methylase UbiE
MKHSNIIRQEFSKQAASFGENGLTLSSQDILEWIVSFLPLDEDFRVLDVAAGTGHLSRAIAPHVKEVVAVDLTPEMLEQARQETVKMHLENIRIEEGNAEELPYDDDSFDLVVSRLAIHHFEQPLIQLQEMVRVCRPNHRIGIIDLLSPEDQSEAEIYNYLEKLRDPSHTIAWSKTQLLAMLSEVGIEVDTVNSRDVIVDFIRWVQMTETKPKTIETIREELVKDISLGTKTGMRPFMKNDSLKFLQVWAGFIGMKRSI